MSAVSGQERGDWRTQVAHDGFAHAEYAQLRALYEIHHESVAEALRSEKRHGLLAFAFDVGSGSLAQQRWFKTRPTAINQFIVGRHRKCHLHLERDPSISLRHLAVVLHPHDPERDACIGYRVLDLRTGLGFADCAGQRLDAVVADGALMLVLGRYALLLLPTGPQQHMPDDTTAAWDLVSDPMHVDGQRAPRDSNVNDLRNDGAQRTGMTVIEGPARAHAGLLGAGEEPLGLIEISAGGEAEALEVGTLALCQGLLLGCYDRCDEGSLAHVRHPNVSRVHLLLLWHQGSLYAIDVATTNGCFVEQGGKRIRAPLLRVSDGMEVVLADDRARVRWRPIDDQGGES